MKISDAETYGAMMVGFWSIEFLDGIMGLMLSFFSTILVAYTLVTKIIDGRQKLKGK